MRKLLVLVFIIGFCNLSFSQLVETLKLPSDLKFTKVEGLFVKKECSQDGKKYECYEFNIPNMSLSYYPLQIGLDCGYFVVNENKFIPNSNKLSCDLDYGSFEVYKLELRSNQFILVNAIGNVSGTATRRVFNNLFKISLNDVVFFPLTSIYGDETNFGDFNSDGELDYLETSYDKFDPDYKTVFSTMSKDQFIKDKTKYIKLTRMVKGKKIKVKIIDKKWF